MKRLLTAITVFLICTMLTLLTALALVRSSKVQTALVGVVTSQIADALHTQASIGAVDIRMPGNLRISHFYLEDQSGDTLLYVPSLEVRFNPFAIENHCIDFRLIRLVQPYVYLKQDSTSTNIDFLLRAFSSSSPSPSPTPFTFSLDNIDIVAARLRYAHLPSHTDVCVEQLDTRLHLPLISQDSLLANLEQLTLRASVPSMDIHLATSLHGTLDTLYADNLEVNYRSERLLLGDAAIFQPLIWDSLQVKIACQDLYARTDLIENLLSDIFHTPQHLPTELRRLGAVHYRGELAGRLDNLRLHGAFLTRLGTITTNLHLSILRDFAQIRYQGRVATKHFQLARLLANDNFGLLSTSINVSGVYSPDQPVNMQGEWAIDELDFNNYHYTDIDILGSFRHRVFDGSVSIQDPNLALHLNGKADFSANQPLAQLALRLEHLRLHDLHLAPKLSPDQDMSLSCSLAFSSDGHGAQLMDRVHGFVQIDSLFFYNGPTANLFMHAFNLRLEQDHNDRQLRILSDFMTAGVSGSYSWSSLLRSVQRIAHLYLPALVPQPVLHNDPNDMDFYVYILDADTILHALGREQLFMPQRQTLKGFIHESDARFGVQAYVPSYESGNSAMRDITLMLNNDNNQANLVLSTFQHTLDHDSTKLILGDLGMYFSTTARHDSLFTTLRFSDTSANHDQSRIDIHTHLARYHAQPFIQTHILPSTFHLGDTVWSVAESTIEYNVADTLLSVNHFDLTTANQFLRVHGVASPRSSDSIRVDLQDIDLHYLLRFIELEKAIDVQGQVSGWATIFSLFSAPMFEASLTIPEGQLNSASIGRVTASATLDRDNHQVLITGDAVQNDHTVAHVDGTVIPEQPYWELFIHADSVDLGMVSFWTNGILDDIQGRGYGDVHVFGRKMKTWVTLRALAQDASLTLPFTGARYYFSDTIVLDTTSINFDHILLHDALNHTAVLNGTITHDMFQSFLIDLDVDCNQILALDLPADQQALYYGKVYATGHVDVTGDDHSLNVDVKAATCGNSDFYLSIATASSAKDNSFISFVQPTTERSLHYSTTGRSPHSLSTPQPQSSTHIHLAMDVTPDAAVHLLMDSHNGDGIVGRGEGALKLNIDDSDVSLVGTYTLQSGTFHYTLANLVKRDFSISRGSTIVWSGVPEDPILNVKAIYHLTASLKDLFGSDAELIATNRNSVPVNCIIYLSDKLSNPVLKFGIELPQSDESVNQQVMSIINTEEMLMREVIYLLVFNRFFTPEYLRKDATSTGLNETYSFLSSTVTGQINAWLSKLTDIFSMGIAIRADVESGNSNNNEYEANFQINPVKRLTINGNFGYRSDDLSNRPFFGDLDVEYQLTPDGKLRAKAYTHTVDKYSLKQANTVQGVGFIYRHDFNWGDARRRREARRTQKTQQSNN